MCVMQEPGMLEQLAQHLPEQHRNIEGLLAVATSSQVLLPAFVPSPQSYCTRVTMYSA